MWKRWPQILAVCLIASVIAWIQFSFISAWPAPFSDINLILIVLIFTLFFLEMRVALLAAFVMGFWLDLLSFHFFGFYLAVFFLVILLGRWILRDRLTNRSFYSFVALMVIMQIAASLLLSGLASFWSASNIFRFLFEGRFWLSLGYQCGWGLLAAVILFNLAALVSKRIKPFFLEKKPYNVIS